MDAAIQNQDADASRTGQEALRRVGDDRAAAFARLFEAVHEGVYIGLLGPLVDDHASLPIRI